MSKGVTSKGVTSKDVMSKTDAPRALGAMKRRWRRPLAYQKRLKDRD
jgi:hypothetical protein